MGKKRIDAFLSPSTYQDKPSSVTLLQTHISWLFFTDDHVYKVKKPVDFGFLDFTTLEKRRFFCHEELRLNRRLSPDIYLGIDELRLNGKGEFSLNGEGETVEYAVKMLRLPRERMMANLIDNNQITATDIVAIARKVASFHGAAASSPEISEYGTAEIILANWDENLRQTTPYLGRTLSAGTLELIGSWARKRINDHSEIIAKRVAEGYIRECDGDLHSENICIDTEIHIFDCIEFNDKFRYSDTAADVAFLAMDLENHGRRDLAGLFVSEYIAASGDNNLPEILPLYLANRAFVRGKVESFRLDDQGIPAEDKLTAAKRARRFFSLCRGYILREKMPLTLFITCAPTGSGKSTLAAELAFQLGIEHLSTDIERKRLASIAQGERGADIYTSAWTKKTYDRLLELAKKKLTNGESVLVDGTFIKRSSRALFASLANTVGSKMIILTLKCPAETVKKQLEARSLSPDSVSDGTWQIYQQQLQEFEAPDSSEGVLVHLQTTEQPEIMTELVLEQLGLFCKVS